MRRWFMLSLVVITVIGLVGVQEAFGATKLIGVTLLTREHQFYRDLEAGLRSEAAKYGFELQVVAGEFDFGRQAGQIDDFISKKVDALIIAPCDSQAVGSSIAEANKAGIPVFTVDIMNLSPQGKVVCAVQSDNVEGGRQAGRLMAQALGGSGKVIIINHPSITSVMDRVSGFRDYLKEYPGIQIVADIPAWGQRSRATAIMEDVLMMMPDIDGVFGINDDSALGALRAIEAARVKRKIAVVGYDGTPEAVQAIKASKIYGDVVQYPRQIGVLAVQAMRDYFNGLPVKPYIPVGVGTITRDNL
ncbi:MAG: substrate-binding domain-containing protein [Bacillota bacterium]